MGKRKTKGSSAKSKNLSAASLTPLAPFVDEPALVPEPVYPRLPLSKLKKARAYLGALKENVALHDPKDIEQARVLELKLAQVERRIATLLTIRVVVYALIYASVISSVVTGFTLLQEFTRTVTFFSSVIGSGVLILALLFLNHVIDSRYFDMQLLSSHLIAIYVKNEDEWRPKILAFIEQSF